MTAATGDLRPGDVVWLVPRTLGAPRICWRQPKATVRDTAAAYLVVEVDGQRHEIHRDNVRRTNPAYARTRKRTTAAKRPPLPTEWEEAPLW